jgi:hypothetical protein
LSYEIVVKILGTEILKLTLRPLAPLQESADGPVAGLVGIGGGVVSGVINLESPSV